MHKRSQIILVVLVSIVIIGYSFYRSTNTTEEPITSTTADSSITEQTTLQKGPYTYKRQTNLNGVNYQINVPTDWTYTIEDYVFTFTNGIETLSISSPSLGFGFTENSTVSKMIDNKQATYYLTDSSIIALFNDRKDDIQIVYRFDKEASGDSVTTLDTLLSTFNFL